MMVMLAVMFMVVKIMAKMMMVHFSPGHLLHLVKNCGGALQVHFVPPRSFLWTCFFH